MIFVSHQYPIINILYPISKETLYDYKVYITIIVIILSYINDNKEIVILIFDL